MNTCQHIFNPEETTEQSILWRTFVYFSIFIRDHHVQCPHHSWLFLSGKSQIVNISSLREIINSFCTYSFSVSANWWFSVCYNLQQQQLSKTILYSESRGNMNTLTLSLASHSICLCPVLGCVLHTGHHCTESPATTPEQVRGRPGVAHPRPWFHFTQHFELWVNYFSPSI